MTKHFYMMRHGQTLFNQLNLIQGWCDSPLTKTGIEQAKTAGNYFKTAGLSFDRLYTSTAERACDTMELMTGRTDYVRHKGLREWGFGRMESQPEFLHPNPLPGQFGHGDYYLRYDGESEQMVQARVNQAVGELVAELEEGQSALAVSHAGAIMNFLLQLPNQDKYPQIHISNCTIFHYEVTDGNFKIIEIIDPITQQVYLPSYESWEAATAHFNEETL